MALADIKALTFDTGGTILDWHTGFKTALKPWLRRMGSADWSELVNEMRKRSLGKMLNLGQHEPPGYNFDGSHQTSLDELLAEHGLDAITGEQRKQIWWDAVHNLGVLA